MVSTRKDGNVLIVELDRPAQGNALNRQTQRDLAQAWRQLDDDDSLLVGVLHGAGNDFSLGHDIDELLSAQGDGASPVPDDDMFPMHIRKPVIAAIEGRAHGLGFELALACDLRVAGEGAQVGFPDPNLYVSYRVGTVLLPRMAFLGLSENMIYSGQVLDAQGARDARIVNQVAPKGGALNAALESAKAMAATFKTPENFRKQEIWGFSGVPLPTLMANARRP